MIFVYLFVWGILIFLIYYIAIQLYIICCSSKGRIKDIEKRNYTAQYQQNITVIVYSHNNSSTIIELIEELKKQDYDKDKYSIHVILDSCTDNSPKLLEILGGTRLWRIGSELEPVGKSKATAWLLERILTSGNTNAFVFLDADCNIKPNFLARVNSALNENSVVVGEIVPTNESSNLITSIFCTQNKIKSRAFRHGRYYASLTNILDQKLWAIRQNIVEKIKYAVIDNGFEEYEYSIKLSQSNMRVAHSSQLCAYKQFSETFSTVISDVYRNRYKSLLTLRNNIKLLLSGSLKTKELLLSLIYPSNITFIILTTAAYITNLSAPASLSSHIANKIIVALFISFLVLRMLSMLVARCSFNDYKNDIFSIGVVPAIYFLSFLQGFRTKFNFKAKLPKREKVEQKEASRKVIDASITDGRKELACQLEIRESVNSAQVVFMFKDKKLSTAKHLRIDKAVEELVEKLKTHGFVLKICMNCGYFNFNEGIACQFNGQQGYCLYDNLNNASKAEEFSYLWNSCSNIVPIQAREHILQQFNKSKVD